MAEYKIIGYFVVIFGAMVFVLVGSANTCGPQHMMKGTAACTADATGAYEASHALLLSRRDLAITIYLSIWQLFSTQKENPHNTTHLSPT